MHAFCRCHAGHWFRNRVEADEADADALILEDNYCPTCDGGFVVVEMVDDNQEP